MSETDLWQELDKCMGKSWHASRVESHSTSAGIPDVDYCYRGDGHVELKFGDKIPNIRDSQVRWLSRRSKYGGKCYILTKVKLIFLKPEWCYLWHLGSKAAYLQANPQSEIWFNHRMNDRYWELDRKETQIILSGKRGINGFSEDDHQTRT